MRARRLRLGLYADEQGLAWVRSLVEDAIGSRHARIIGGTLAHTVDDELDFLVEQWTVEHPGQTADHGNRCTWKSTWGVPCGRGGRSARPY
ncbi:hypothetical protein [Streptomyces erythrochromogenes]|uniref:hypothetical protein n=1 Tax=Streptomyces erythrochromogenes TaxID=285574 RepID=UPI00099C369A|nr:hypothetical protein [Streptomyces erythrochromogenes]